MELSVCHLFPLNTYFYAQEENLGLTEHLYTVTYCLLVLPYKFLHYLHPRSVDGLEYDNLSKTAEKSSSSPGAVDVPGGT
jgi:hypothetical protein